MKYKHIYNGNIIDSYKYFQLSLKEQGNYRIYEEDSYSNPAFDSGYPTNTFDTNVFDSPSFDLGSSNNSSSNFDFGGGDGGGAGANGDW